MYIAYSIFAYYIISSIFFSKESYDITTMINKNKTTLQKFRLVSEYIIPIAFPYIYTYIITIRFWVNPLIYSYVMRFFFRGSCVTLDAHTSYIYTCYKYTIHIVFVRFIIWYRNLPSQWSLRFSSCIIVLSDGHLLYMHKSK